MPTAIPRHLVRTAEAAITHELKEQRNHLAIRRACCLALGLYGLRMTEVRNLVKRNHNAEAATLRVNTIKHGRPRVIELHPAVNRVLTKVNEDRRPGAVLICTRSKKQLTTWSVHHYAKWLANILRVPLSFHSLRHTAAVRLYEQTHDVYAVQRFLGHATLSQTHVYLQTTNPVAAALGPNFSEHTIAPLLHTYTGPMDDESRAASIRHRLIEGRLPPARGIHAATSQQSRTADTARQLSKALGRLPTLEREKIIRDLIMQEWPRETDAPAETRGNNANHPNAKT